MSFVNKNRRCFKSTIKSGNEVSIEYKKETVPGKDGFINDSNNQKQILLELLKKRYFTDQLSVR